MDKKENNIALNSSFIHLCQMNAAPEFNVSSDSSMGEPSENNANELITYSK